MGTEAHGGSLHARQGLYTMVATQRKGKPEKEHGSRASCPHRYFLTKGLVGEGRSRGSPCVAEQVLQGKRGSERGDGAGRGNGRLSAEEP